MKSKSFALLVIGIVLVLGGIIYDVMFAGIPYQDPTPELSNQYNTNSNIATVLMCSGIFVVIISIIFLLKNWRKK